MLKAFYVLQGLYALRISLPLGIICFRHFISFRNYMLQAFHKSHFVLPKCLHLWHNVKNVSKLNFICNSFTKEHVSFLFIKRQRHLGTKGGPRPCWLYKKNARVDIKISLALTNIIFGLFQQKLTPPPQKKKKKIKNILKKKKKTK